jgi:hypothetical protein
MECYIKFLPSVIEYLVQVCQINYIPATWNQIICTCMSDLERWSEWNDTCNFLQSVITSLVQVCLTKSIGQNGMIY